jgi:hypothetical protein
MTERLRNDIQLVVFLIIVALAGNYWLATHPEPDDGCRTMYLGKGGQVTDCD